MLTYLAVKKEVEDALNTIDDPQYQVVLHDYIIEEKRFSRNGSTANRYQVKLLNSLTT